MTRPIDLDTLGFVLKATSETSTLWTRHMDELAAEDMDFLDLAALTDVGRAIIETQRHFVHRAAEYYRATNREIPPQIADAVREIDRLTEGL